MDPEPSTSKGATSKTSARDDGGLTPSDGVPEVLASTSGPVPVQQDQFVFCGPVPVSGKQCLQLFGSTCRVKVQRCEVPNPVTPAANSSTVATPFASDAPSDSTTTRKVEQESDITGGGSSPSSSEEDDEIKVLATFPPSASSTNKKKTAATKKKGVKGVSQRKSSPSVYCTICKKTFSSKGTLRVHSRKHTGEMRYRCETCGRPFWSNSAFVGHKKARDRRNGVCPQETTKRDGGWRPKGPWTCKICGKRMKASSGYVGHMRSHRGEKPFKCGECGKAFVRKDYLSLHKGIHNGVMPHSCVFCDRGFLTKYSYWNHLRGHTEEKPYFCVVDGCGQSFRLNESLKQHRRLIHLKKY